MTDTPATPDTQPTREAIEEAKQAIGSLVIMHGFGCVAERMWEAEVDLAARFDRFAAHAAAPVSGDARERARLALEPWFNAPIDWEGEDGWPLIECVAAALTAAMAEEKRAEREECAQIARKYRTETELARHKTADGEDKASWLWAFDTSNAIEREIRALKDAPPGEGDTK